MALFKRVAAADIELKNGTVLRVRDLRITFDITKTKGSTTNKAKIKITNLSQETRAKLREKDALVRLYAGYEGDLGAVLIFVGNTQHLVNEWQTPDIVTSIEAQDGQKVLRQTRISFSYNTRTAINTIVNRIAGEIGIPLKQDFTIDGYYNGFSFNGLAKDALDAICRKTGYSWSVQDNEIQIVKKDGSTNTTAVKLSPETGLINQPERMADQEGQFEDALQSELAWKITSLLNPRLQAGGLVQLESKQATGTFIIEKVRHYGDSRGKEWYSEIEVKPR